MERKFEGTEVKNPLCVKGFKKMIGIDPGVNTGFALDGVLQKVSSSSILKVMEFCKGHQDALLIIEDARKLKWGGYNKRNGGRAQGAGSVKRDASIWEEFAINHGFYFVLLDPRRNRSKKIDAKKFKVLTGWEGRTNEHGRDAAMMVVRRKSSTNN